MQESVVLNPDDVTGILFGALEYNGRAPTEIRWVDSEGQPVEPGYAIIGCGAAVLRVRVAPDNVLSDEEKVAAYSRMGLKPKKEGQPDG